MENIYFKGLQKALNNSCYIKVFSCGMRYPVARVEKNKDHDRVELISYAEGGNILSVLNSASNKIVAEITTQGLNNPIWCERTFIDDIVDQGYTLHFYKLSNNKILSMICSGRYENYIPLKSVITDDIKSGFETLNATLQSFKSNDFLQFAESQIKTINEYQKK